MKIMLITDVEGVSGVLNFADWCTPDSRYYEKAQRLLTLEANAVIDGFFAGGAKEILVVDGHGPGAIDPELLDERVELQRGQASPVWPFTLDASFDGIAWVGQHAKSGTPWSHITHTGTFAVKDMTVNGISIGEFGEMAYAASELNVPVIFAGGEQAFAEEAAELVPGLVTAGTKRGCNSEENLSEATAEVYEKSKLSAIHLSPAKARAMLREGALHAMEKLRNNIKPFPQPVLSAPYEIKTVFRKIEARPDAPQVLYKRHDKSFIAALNAPYTTE